MAVSIKTETDLQGEVLEVTLASQENGKARELRFSRTEAHSLLVRLSEIFSYSPEPKERKPDGDWDEVRQYQEDPKAYAK